MTPKAWSSRFAFLMAATGFAVGLGNIWRFPYVAGENGGSAFVLIYLVWVVVIGVPILMAEIMLGRRGRLTPPAGLTALARESRRSAHWAWLGNLNLLTAYAIQVVYAVIIGWVLYFLYLSFTGTVAQASATSAPLLLAGLLQDVPIMLLCTGIAIGIAGLVVFAGLSRGIEPAVKVLMPLLFLLLIALAIFNAFNGGMSEALTYLFAPDFGKVTPGVLLAAIGQAFFSIGVAMAAMMMFGAYLPQHISIARSALLIVTVDTLVAITAGLVIFPLVFKYGLDPAGGPGLIFQTLPIAFAQMGQATVVASLFFLLLSVAGITSLVGFMEPLVARVEERFAVSRRQAMLGLLPLIIAGSIISVLSYNVWAQVSLFDVPLETILDFVPNQIFLPLGGLLIAIFAGWFMRPEWASEELKLSTGLFKIWHTALRFVVVPLVAVIFITGLVAE
ncbi:MAG: sodium-dependent transporter [Pseudomonadales bacterium]